MNAKQIKILIKEYASKNDRKNIFRLFTIKTGKKIEYSPTGLYFEIGYFVRKYCGIRFYRNNHDIWNFTKNYHYTQQSNYYKRIMVIEKLKDELLYPFTNYTKLPYYGYTHLYFCSPIYVHSDYNKWRAIEIKGNEKFCEKIINIAKSKYPQFY